MVAPADSAALTDFYTRVRGFSLELCETLGPEDMTIQSMSDVSPTKWHLAHVTWFFEHFILRNRVAGYHPIDDQYHYLFNSYYYTVGDMYQRPRRGLISRPTVDEIVTYRRHVDAHMLRLIEGADRELAFLVTLGLNHEQQHQELMLTDIKHVLAQNPMSPVFRETAAEAFEQCCGSLAWHAFPVGIK